MKTVITMLVLTVLGSAINAQNIKLPAPQKSGGKALMDCLNERQTDRNFDTKQLSLQDLSDLVWAANGLNRPEAGKRTVPTATNWQEMVLYVATTDGIYRYNEKNHELELVKKGDYRKDCGPQPFMTVAPVCFIYTADHNKEGRISDPEKQKEYSFHHAGYMAQTVYLVCASKNMATVVIGSADRENLAKVIGLPAKHIVTYTQPVGYKKK
ncbi:SagB/ThcOx family dehydrogenase [Butyricimonas paravirosa]|uniref:SagB/ThcOx family dehydrogenase n=1 Tax=Butyricimonas paravirosa TaxID=1472417 RepID=UPI00210E15AE|nr:SagB/ThcOx family dehydrogenase [Butyricimonas paravirosa]MCQ4875771.1 SagB/ThcOx family dehydrogenase [Butyricimonas paravirosa]